jgi:hypothetical protein
VLPTKKSVEAFAKEHDSFKLRVTWSDKVEGYLKHDVAVYKSTVYDASWHISEKPNGIQGLADWITFQNLGSIWITEYEVILPLR